jgi:hypothetical protein
MFLVLVPGHRLAEFRKVREEARGGFGEPEHARLVQPSHGSNAIGVARVRVEPAGLF